MEYDVFISYARKDYVTEEGTVIPGNIVSQIKDVLMNNDISFGLMKKACIREMNLQR